MIFGQGCRTVRIIRHEDRIVEKDLFRLRLGHLEILLVLVRVPSSH